MTAAPPVGLTPPAPADHGSLSERAERADVVFVGHVVAVDYAMSQPTDDQGPVVHTFVTYEVEAGFKHAAAGERFTLRLIGGLSKDDTILIVSHQPRIDLGDRDLLFVAGNGERACPLLDCEDGRLRILDGRVVTEGGGAIGIDGDLLSVGKLVRHDDIDTHWVAGQALHTDPVDAAVDVADSGAARLEELTAQLGSLGLPDGSADAFSVDPTAPFHFHL